VFKKIAIVGLGLMGGSLAVACRKKFPKARITGISRSREALTLAKKKKWVHEATQDVLLGTHGADLVVLCTPVDTFLPYLKAIDKVCAKDALVMDVGSVKISVLKEVNSHKWKNLSFVGCHPMVGSHKRGIEVACPKLYEQGIVILTRTKKTCPESYRKAWKFWARFSKKVVHLTPQLHDKLISEISHLPHAIAVCLAQTASRQALPFAAKGFRDTTRIAASASSVWLPIFEANKKYILADLVRFERELKRFKKALRRPEPSALRCYLDTAGRRRRSI